jgi:hypothetical protein
VRQPGLQWYGEIQLNGYCGALRQSRLLTFNSLELRDRGARRQHYKLPEPATQFRGINTPIATKEVFMNLAYSARWFCAVTIATVLPGPLSLISSVNAQRLPTNVRPDHYAMTLTPDLQSSTFAGIEQIDVDLDAPTDHITLNAIELTIHSVTITADGVPQTATISEDHEKEQVTFTFPTQLRAGKAVLDIQYTGILNSKLRGFYLSKTAARNYAVTQFEATDARRAFPSFDEPTFKATYDIA